MRLALQGFMFTVMLVCTAETLYSVIWIVFQHPNECVGFINQGSIIRSMDKHGQFHVQLLARHCV